MHGKDKVCVYITFVFLLRSAVSVSYRKGNYYKTGSADDGEEKPGIHSSLIQKRRQLILKLSGAHGLPKAVKELVIPVLLILNEIDVPIMYVTVFHSSARVQTSPSLKHCMHWVWGMTAIYCLALMLSMNSSRSCCWKTSFISLFIYCTCIVSSTAGKFLLEPCSVFNIH